MIFSNLRRDRRPALIPKSGIDLGIMSAVARQIGAGGAGPVAGYVLRAVTVESGRVDRAAGHGY